MEQNCFKSFVSDSFRCADGVRRRASSSRSRDLTPPDNASPERAPHETWCATFYPATLGRSTATVSAIDARQRLQPVLRRQAEPDTPVDCH